MVVTVTFGAVYLAGGISLSTLLTLVASNYAFKALVALLDTLPLYYLVGKLRAYLQVDVHETATAYS